MQDIVIFPAQGRRTKQRVGSIALLLLLAGLLVGAIAMFLTEGGVIPVVVMVILAVALYGLVRTSLIAFRSDPEGGYGAVLVVNGEGIGDGHLLLPWSQVTDVRVQEIRSYTGRRTAGARLSNTISNEMGVLDGEFNLHVHVKHPPPHHGLVSGRHSQPHPEIVVYHLQRDIPSEHWTQLGDAIRAHARAHGIPTN